MPASTPFFYPFIGTTNYYLYFSPEQRTLLFILERNLNHHLPNHAGHFLCIRLLFVIFLTSPALQAGIQENPNANSLKNKAEDHRYRNQYDSALFYFQAYGYSLDAEYHQRDLIINSLNIIDLYITRQDFATAGQALNQLERALPENLKTDPLIRAEVMQVSGALDLATGKINLSRKNIQEAIRLRESENGPDDTLLRYAYNKLGNLYLATGDYALAYATHENALRLARLKKNPENFLSASSYQNLGIAAHMQGDYTLAESLFLKSLQLNEQLFSISDPALASIYINIGKFYNDISKYELALKYYDKAELVLSSHKTEVYKKITSSLLWNKGNIFVHQGDYEKGINFLNKAFALYIETDPSDVITRMRIQMDIGLAYDLLGNTNEALNHYLKVVHVTDNPYKVKLLRNIGNLYSRLNKNDSANYFYVKAIINARKYSTSDNYDLGLCYQYFGENLRATNKDSAILYLNNSLKTFRNLFGDRNKDVSRAKLRLAELHIEKNDLKSALALTQEAINSFIPDYLIGNPEISKSTNEIFLDINIPDALNIQSQIFVKRYYLNNDLAELQYALNSINQSWLIIDMIRRSYSDEESQMVLLNFARVTVDLGMVVSLKLYETTGDSKYLEEAFGYSEKGKAVILLGALRGLEARARTTIPAEIVSKEKNLNTEIAFYNNQVYEEKKRKMPDQGKLSRWNDKLFMFRNSYDSLISLIKDQYPDYYALKYDYSIIEAESVPELIESDQVMISYHFADTMVYGFFIGREQFYFKQLGRRDTLVNKVNQLRQMFSSGSFFDADQNAFRELTLACSALYQFLVFPFSKDIRDKRLLIIPDGELGYLPFDMLLVNSPENNSAGYSSLDWLIRHHAVSYASSATVYFESMAKNIERERKRKLLAIAPSYNFSSNLRSRSPELDSSLFRLTPIKGTHEEVNQIAKYYKTTKYFDERATESAFKRMAGDYNLLHLAMHTMIDDQNPLYSKLVFTLTPGDSTDDGLLNTYELFSLDLKGELAVLSACNTGTGKLERGEGIISLARGFFYAGIPSVIMTLWEIEDHSSAGLMDMFYRNLQDGLPKDIALQQAKISYLEKAGKLYSHPYFWAGFVNIGKTSPVAGQDHGARNSIVAGLILALAIGIAFLVINRRVYSRKKPL